MRCLGVQLLNLLLLLLLHLLLHLLLKHLLVEHVVDASVRAPTPLSAALASCTSLLQLAEESVIVILGEHLSSAVTLLNGVLVTILSGSHLKLYPICELLIFLSVVLAITTTLSCEPTINLLQVMLLE